MGEVWKAIDQELSLPVALKVLPPILSGNSRAMDALKREAALSLKLTHPHICRIYNFHTDGRLGFLVMELIDGATLEQILDSRPNRRMGLEEVLPLFRAIAAALDHAHRQQPQILHRDIKPANIMVNAAGEPKLMDFGIACEIKDNLTRLTNQEAVGTLSYMPPEQFLGKKLVPATDQYALAATLYECLAGHPPFHRGHIGHQLLNMPPESLIEMGLELSDKAVLRALAKEPGERFATVGDFVRELAEAFCLSESHRKKQEEEARRKAVEKREKTRLEEEIRREQEEWQLQLRKKREAADARKREEDEQKKREEEARQKQQNTLDYFKRAELSRLKGDYDQAVVDYAEAIQLDPEYAWAYCERGRSYWQKGNYDQAIADHTDAIRLDPEIWQAHYFRGMVYLSKSDFGNAIADLTEAQRLNPNHAPSFLRRGLAFGAKGNCVQAIADYAEAFRLVPNDPSAIAVLTEVLRLEPGRQDIKEQLEKTRLEEETRREQEEWQLQKQEAAQAGETLINSLGMRFAWIPPGTFLMGSSEWLYEIYDQGQHRVTLTQGFYMGVYTVTQEQWLAIMGSNPSHFKGKNNLPAESISWDDCQEFIKKLREKDKQPYRVPTEAEWEYACRAGTTTWFYFGETISTDQANYNGDSVDRAKTTPVGSFPANGWGLHDMHGNVYEWCQDWYGHYPIDEDKDEKEIDAVDPRGPNTGDSRVVRGGNWQFGLFGCRSASRDAFKSGSRVSTIGFRLCFGLEGLDQRKEIEERQRQEQEAEWAIRKAAEQGHSEAQFNLGVMYANGRGVSKSGYQAVEWYRKAAEQGLSEAQFNLGVMYAIGRGVPKDDLQAASWHRKAAENGHAQAIACYRMVAENGDCDAQLNIGLMYKNGRGVAKDDAQAVEWFRKAAEQGHSEAQFNLGVMYANGLGVAKDDVQAVAWYCKAAQQENSGAQTSLGLMYDSGRGVARNYVQAVAWYRKAAEQGNSEAQFDLGVMYMNGRGVPKDDVQALAWYRKAAEQGHSGAQNNLGVMCENGRGVPKDDVQAVAWYRKAAEQGQSIPQNNLGIKYAYGQGVAQDYAQAVAWYRKAAEQGYSQAQFNLGAMYDNGQGVAKDDAQAVAWYRKAAEQGHSDAQYYLGLRYEKGHGVPQDDVQAVAWFRKAAEQGHSQARSNLGVRYANARAVAWYRKAEEEGLDDEDLYDEFLDEED